MSEPETELRIAVRKRNISRVRNLVTAQPTEASSVIGTVLYQILHDRVLVVKRADLALRSTRDEFLTGLRKLVAERGTDLQAIELDHIIRQSAITQSLFDKLLVQLEGIAAFKPLQLNLAWSCILLAQHEVSQLVKSVTQSIDRLQNSGGNSLSVSYTSGETTVEIDADELLFKIEQVLSTQLNWFAYSQNWWKKDLLELPFGNIDAAEQLVPAASAIRELAVRWDSIDQSDINVAIFGGDVVELEDFELKGSLIEYREKVDEKRAIYVAGKRLNSTISRTKVTDLAEGQWQQTPLSPIEARDFVLFKELTGHSPFDSKFTLLGLAPWEWIRCYTALGQMARIHLRSEFSRLPICMRASELSRNLTEFGLSEIAGERFVELTRFATTSTDMFDCPVVRVEGDRLVILPFVSAIQSATRLVLSQRARFGIDIPEAGNSLEKDVVALFQQGGAIARRLKETVGTDAFEIDCLALWGDILFVIECKNQMLPKETERSRQLFWNDQLIHASQLLRNVTFVRDNKELIWSKLEGGGTWKRIVPMVIHGMPFSLALPLNGVAFCDKQILTQFFTTGRSLDFPDIHFWRGDGPCPEDLADIAVCNRVVQRMLTQFQEEHTEFSVAEKCKVRVTHLRYCSDISS